MNKKIIPLLLAGSTLLIACNEEKTAETASAVVSKADAIAEVNGQYISKAALSALEKEIAQRSRGQSFPKEKLIEELVQRELLLQDAINKQLDKTAEFKERLATARNSLLSQAAIQNHMKSSVITDVDLRAEYDKNIASAGTEYKARHILVKTEEEAKAIIQQLTKGDDFVALAKSKSTGPSGPQGGDLGWFGSGQMVAPFSEAVIALADNKFTTEPVQTQFGWHVILREGSRQQTPPPFDSVKEQIRPMLQRNKMKNYLDTLRSQAKVEVILPPAAVIEKKDANALSVGKSLDATAAAAASATNKTIDQAKDAVKNAADTASDAVEKTKNTAVDKASNAINKLSDAVTQ